MNVLQSEEDPSTRHSMFLFVPAHPREKEVVGSEAACMLKFKIGLSLAYVDGTPEDKQ